MIQTLEDLLGLKYAISNLLFWYFEIFFFDIVSDFDIRISNLLLIKFIRFDILLLYWNL